MNGKSLYLRQLSSGVRDIVEDVDALRMKLGFANVVVETPKVETRLRSGFLAAIPMKVNCLVLFSEGDCCLSLRLGFTYPMGYAKTAHLGVDVEILDMVGDFVPSNEILKEYLESSLLKLQKDEDDKSLQLQVGHSSLDIIALLKSYFLDHIVTNQPDEVACSLVVNDNFSGVDVDSLDNVPVTSLFDGTSGINPEASVVDDSIPVVKVSSDESTIHFEDNGALHNPQEYNYACMRCRFQLFSGADLMTHDVHAKSQTITSCSSHFLSEAPSWLVIKDNETMGKLNCPNCNGKLGSWGWVGCACSCGAWVAPAFQLTKSKVDPKKV